MLPVEFYTLNATTTLLWLCQTCPHEVLLFLIMLGALGVVICLCMIVYSILVRCSFLLGLVLSLCNLFLRYILTKFLHLSIVDNTNSVVTNDVLALRNNIPARLMNSASLPARLEAAVGSLTNRIDTSGRRLSLPQTLALHPQQWAEIEAARTPTSLPESVQSNIRSPRITPTPEPRITAASHAPLRRSNRIPRTRILYSSCLIL